jgi:hypothetical protein
MQTRESIGERGIAVPAMFGAVTVFDFALVGRVRGSLQEILDVVNRMGSNPGLKPGTETSIPDFR